MSRALTRYKRHGRVRFSNGNNDLEARVRRQGQVIERLAAHLLPHGSTPIPPNRNAQIGGGQIAGAPGKGGSIITPAYSDQGGDPIWESGDGLITPSDGPWDIAMTVDDLAALQGQYICWLTVHGMPLDVARRFTMTCKINGRATFGGVERQPVDASVPNASVPNQRLRLAEPNGGCAPELPPVSRLLFRFELAVASYDPPAGVTEIDPQITLTGGASCDMTSTGCGSY